MTEEIDRIVDEYLDKFISSDLVLINTLKRVFLERIKEREIKKVTSYIFLNELYLEKI